MLETVIFSTLDKTANRYILLNSALFIFSTAESNGYLTRVYIDCRNFEMCQCVLRNIDYLMVILFDIDYYIH